MKELIKTGWRHPLLKGFSNPVGAEIISKALADIPQYSDLQINYSGGPGRSLGEFTPSIFQVKVKGSKAGKLHEYQSAIEIHYDFAELSIHVEAVESSQKSSIRSLLIEGSLPRIRSWLICDRPETWYEGDRYFVLAFNHHNLNKWCSAEYHREYIINVERFLISPKEVEA